MELVRGLHNVDRAARGCVLTIGAFDGIHRGHQEMIRVLRTIAATQRLPAALLSFEPTPREFFAKATPPARLTRFREKYEALRHYGVERFVCLRFDASLRSMSPDEFIGNVLVDALGARHVVVGHDFKFGRSMAGNVETLRVAGPARRICGHRSAAVRDRRRAGQQFADSSGTGRWRHGSCYPFARAAVPDDGQGR